MRKVYQQVDKQDNNEGTGNIHFLPGPDNDFILNTVDLVLANSTTVIHDMYEHLEQNDYNSLRITARNYKSTVKTLGNAKLVELLKQIETNASAGAGQTTLAPLITELNTISGCFVRQLNSGLRKLKKQAA